MANKTNFFVVSLIAMMAVAPAVADTPATQEWTKSRDDYKISTINTRLATDVRDKVYNYDTNKSSPTYQQVLDPLNTEAETAFSGINEVLQKVNGNDGTANSAVTLETTAQNAFGAINELKGALDDKADAADLADLVTENDLTTALADKADTTDLASKQDSLSEAQLAAANSGVTAAKVSTYDGYASTIAGKADATDLASKQDSLSEAQLAAANSGITAAKVSTYDGYASTIAGKADASDLTTLSDTVGSGAMTVNGANQATVIAAINALDTKTNGLATDQNLTDLQTNVTGLSTTVGNTALTTTAQTLTGAVNELKGDIADVLPAANTCTSTSGHCVLSIDKTTGALSWVDVTTPWVTVE